MTKSSNLNCSFAAIGQRVQKAPQNFGPAYRQAGYQWVTGDPVFLLLADRAVSH